MLLGTDAAGVEVRKLRSDGCERLNKVGDMAESGLKRKRTEKVWNTGNVFFTLISLLICLLFLH